MPERSGAEMERVGRLPYDAWVALLHETRARADSRDKLATSMISTLKMGFGNMELEGAAIAKKCMAFLAALQEELSLCMKDTGAKLKEYTADQASFAKAKEKVDKEEEKGKVGKKSDKLKEKLEAAWKKVQNSRNDYLLSLQTLNVQQDRYFKIEIPALVDKMDTNFHVTLQTVRRLNLCQLENTDGAAPTPSVASLGVALCYGIYADVHISDDV